MPLFLTYIGILIAFVAIDLTWILLIAKNFYFSRLWHLLAEKALIAPAVIFYLLYLAGIIYFAVLPWAAKQSVGLAALSGAFLGLLCYATYDLTNHATMKNWPWQVTVVDMTWWTLLTAILSVIGYMIYTSLTK